MKPRRGAIDGVGEIGERAAFQGVLKACFGVGDDGADGGPDGGADGALRSTRALARQQRLVGNGAVDVLERDHVWWLGKAIPAVTPFHRIDQASVTERGQHAPHT